MKDHKKKENMTSRTAGTKLWLVLWKASRSLAGYAQRSIASLNMCGTDFAILEALLHKGAMPVNTIGKKVLITSGSITAAIDRLTERGLVERFDDSSDRRVRLVCLTKSGRQLIQTAFAKHEKHLNRAVFSLNTQELEVLVQLLKKLGKEVDYLITQDADISK